MDPFFRIATLVLHVIRFLYWIIAEIQGDSQKPKLQKISSGRFLKRLFTFIVVLIMCAQLLGLRLIPFEQHEIFQFVGFIFVVTGIFVTMLARWTLGSNWSHAAEHQIRKNHSLITHGIYSFIRHPLYTGMYLAVVGAEIVAGSYLFIAVGLFGIYVGYKQAKSEERVLAGKFKSQYISYMKRTKMFIPYVW